MSQSQLSRTFEVLNLVANSQEGITYTEIGTKCNDIAIATLARLLKSLVQEKLLQKATTGKYYLGSAAISFAHKVVTVNSTEEIIRPIVETLAEKAEQSAVYFEIDGDALRLISKKEWPGSLFYRQVGARNDRVFSHPSALTILAFSDEEFVKFLIKTKKLPRDESNQLNDRLEEIRQQGYFIGNDPGYPCSRAVFPVYQTGEIKGSLGVCMLGQNLKKSQLEHYSSVVEKYAKKACEHISLRI
jgi:DNA-binding IclR family transcriptional regulator